MIQPHEKPPSRFHTGQVNTLKPSSFQKKNPKTIRALPETQPRSSHRALWLSFLERVVCYRLFSSQTPYWSQLSGSKVREAEDTILCSSVLSLLARHRTKVNKLALLHYCNFYGFSLFIKNTSLILSYSQGNLTWFQPLTSSLPKYMIF